MTATEEYALLAAAKAGDTRAQARLAESQAGVVGYYAGRMARSPTDRDDLRQEGMLAILHAIKLFDFVYGVRFVTYATLWIKARLRQWLVREARVHAPTLSDRLPADENGYQRHAHGRVVSLNAPLWIDDNNDVPTYVDRIGVPARETCDAAAVRRVALAVARESGDPRMEVIVRRRLLADDRLQEVGDDLHLSREAVRIMADKLIHQVRRKLLREVQ